MAELPYVVSGELEFVDRDAIKRDEVDGFRDSLVTDLQSMGKEVEWVDGCDLRSGIDRLIQSTCLPTVSLDRRYVSDADGYISMSRAVNIDLSDAGYDARANTAPIAEQLDEIGNRYSGKEIVVVDDVLFSGEMIAVLAEQLASRGVSVPAVVCGIAIGMGEKRLQALGIEVESITAFSDVEDEICERDFTVLPGSGRKIFGRRQNALYFDNQFGRPEEWASIPNESVTDFCVASLRRNRRLLKAGTTFPPFLGYPRGEAGKVLDVVLNERTQAEMQ